MTDPMATSMDDSAAGDQRLRHIQALQFSDRPAAEALLLAFVGDTFPDLDAVAVELRPLAVSLNSFNGFLTLNGGRKLFFKTHVEPGSIVSEYYNSDLLAKAGYPIIRPLYASTEYGKQFLIYDLIDSPSVFDVARAIERGERDDLDHLTEMQHHADKQLLDIYLNTIEWQSAEDAAKAPIHQLFYHRLGSRYEQFYVGKPFVLPGNVTLSWDELLRRRWRINGLPYEEMLGAAIENAKRILDPHRAGWSVIGHGDAHNGNVFMTPGELVYFDPAFGGRHHPYLDLAKPLFHNISATWMYHPQEVAATLNINCHDDGTTITVEHDYTLSPGRKMFQDSKGIILNLLESELIRRKDAMAPQTPHGDISPLLRYALMCCPLLTMNLADRERFSPEIGLLGLSYVIQHGLTAG